MKKALFLLLGLLSVTLDSSAVAATARASRAGSGGAAANAPATKTTAARAAVNTRTAPRAAAPTATTGGRTTAARSAKPAATTAQPKTVAARAATQKVIGSGTKVAGAAKNIVVSEECQAKYDGCMDAFCMLDNESGGRCLCSNRNEELDFILNEIEKLDEQSYQMATLGVEKLEMGADADEAIAAANAVADSLKRPEAKKSAREALDLSAWNVIDDDVTEDEVFDVSSSGKMMTPIDGKTGDALHLAAADLCKAQIPECAKDINMLQMMYGQRIKSDCAAYENSLKQRKTQSAQKLQTAERALREAALEQYQNANKFDLGQCTIKFKECMQTTAGCGNDFSSCASVVASDTTNVRKSSSNSNMNYKIEGAVTHIEISASTYDTLVAKKPLCENVTKQCTKVASQVWDTFLKEVAPQLKSAELIAEDDARQNCIGNISECFQKACKDTMDPKDPDGSYDMCLSRPETMLNVCKVPLNACGIDATSASAAQKSQIWDFVVARLNAIKVDACTTEVKECLTAEDVCGKDYLNCIGLDNYTIINMCHRDKLTACYSRGGSEDDQTEYIYSVVQGLMLNIDNEFLAQCQKAADEAMIKVCGDTQNCDSMTITEGVGANALEYKVCEYTPVSPTETVVGKVTIKTPKVTDKYDDNGNKLVSIGASERVEDVVAKTSDIYAYYNCKPDVALIPDEELLGQLVYEEGQMFENKLSAGDQDSEWYKKMKKYANSPAGTVEHVKFKTYKALYDLMDRTIEQDTIKYKYKSYTGYKQFAGVIDGVVNWGKLHAVVTDDCDGDGQEDYAGGGSYLCITGQNDIVQTQNLGQNGVAKQEQILSDVGSLMNSINNTIAAIESDPTVQFCMTGRKVQGLKIFGKEGEKTGTRNAETEARFPNLIDTMKVTVAQSAFKKAQDNYNKKYKELDTQMRKDNVKLAERIAQVREKREMEDRAEVAARACLNLGMSAALPVSSGSGGSKDAQGYTAVSKNDDPYYRETVTTTFSPTTLICKKCTRIQTCTKQAGYKDCCLVDSRHCKEWAEPVETCEETQY